MKKIIIILFISILLLGCESNLNTPTSKVEEFLGKYQTLDKKVLDELNIIIDRDNTITEKEKEEYKKLIEKQYKNLSYKIKGEFIRLKKATVNVEIEVFDYANTVSKVKRYYKTHENEFKNKENYLDYKLKQLEKTIDKTKYEIIFNLEKSNNNWILNNISDSDRQKIHGLF